MAGETPEHIGPYQILEVLGEGGMGAVFRARHIEHGTIVALKTVRVTKESLFNNLRREIHTLARLDHPGIVQIVDLSDEGEKPWYAMEYIEGVTLRHYVLGAHSSAAHSALHSSRASLGDQTQAPVIQGPAAVLSSAITQWMDEEDEQFDIASIIAQMDAFAPGITQSTNVMSSLPSMLSQLEQKNPRKVTSSTATDVAEPYTPSSSSPRLSIPNRLETTALPEGAARAIENPLALLDEEVDPDEAMTILDVSPFHGLELPSMQMGDAEPEDLGHSKAPEEGKAAVLSPSIGSSDTLLGVSPFSQAISSDELHKALRVILGLCDPLAYLHGEGVVHCDLKPENVLVRANGQPVLIDFGLLAVFAGWFNREVADLTRAGLGTLPYMAPEQISGQLIDARTDLYALGCILYELVVGEPPFVGNWTELIGCHLFTQPIPPQQRREGIPDALNQLILKLLEKEPRNRIGHVDTVRAVLEQLLPHSSDYTSHSTAHSPSRMYLFRPEIAGRKNEMYTLRSFVQNVKDGGRGLVLIGGESGVGKTRLMLEVAQFARTHGLRVLSGECPEQPSPPLEVFRPFFLAVADRIRALGQEAREQLLGERGASLLPYAPVLQDAALSDEQSDLDEALSVPPSQLRMNVFRALGHVLHQFAQEQPILLMLDDLHWADELTLGALVHLARMRALEGVLIIGSFRSEEARVALHLLQANETVTCIELERLNEEAVASIVHDMLALEDVPLSFVQYLTTQSEGNPFFIAEYLRAAVEEGLLWRNESGVWEISEAHVNSSENTPASLVALPSSLQQLVARRLQDVSDKGSALLGAASVIGREIPLHLLRQVVQMDMTSLWSTIDVMRRRQILDYRFDGTLCFVHDKIREILYENLAPHERKDLHQRAAQAYEVIFRKELSEYVTHIAYHWDHGEEPERAALYYKHAARRAQQRHGNDEAVQLYQAYLDLPLAIAPEHIEILHALSGLYEQLEMMKLADKTCQQALSYARQLEQRSLEGKTLFLLGGLSWRSGALERGKELYEEALIIQRELNEQAPLGVTLSHVARYAVFEGRLQYAWELYEEALSYLRPLKKKKTIGRTLCEMGDLKMIRGEWKEAKSLYLESLQLFREVQDVLLEGIALHSIAKIHQFLKSYSSATTLHIEALECFCKAEHEPSQGMVQTSLAMLYREQGSFERAEQSFQEALALHRDSGDPLWEAFSLIEYVQLRRWMGEPVHTLELGIMHAQQLISNTPDSLHHVRLLCEQGHVLLADYQSGRHALKRATQRLHAVHIPTDTSSPLGQIVDRLQRAVETFEEGGELLYGEALEALPDALQPLALPTFQLDT